ncbi:MAG: hypothetical protein HOH80_15310 [Rhodospirillaceae bacterium]|nr:hypothetical protein [Rhodospirillales bacterium]MBT4117366.1 hypothetical protein [Rhodospirillaceae bacterium]MBT5840365.1 hypothetical protein [Rhodospirillaceae bacterium]MBT7235720.1 hypothetical protein [Rhodospirillaceae bacterium]MBT7570413.1 hypothetical protein [Rhodospirillaceae bacterium]
MDGIQVEVAIFGNILPSITHSRGDRIMDGIGKSKIAGRETYSELNQSLKSMADELRKLGSSHREHKKLLSDLAGLIDALADSSAS